MGAGRDEKGWPPQAVKTPQKPKSLQASGAADEAPVARRVFGGVVHDERGNATLLWASADDASGARRVPLAIVDDRPNRRRPKDLRKLGEWIKLQRAVAARRNGEQDQDED